MSLINDALRRASQTEKNRPQRVPTPMGMEPTPVAKSSPLPIALIATVVVALALAGWFFWQWWGVRNSNVAHSPVTMASMAPPVTPRINPPPAVVPKPIMAPKPAPVVAAAPVAPPKPAPPPLVVAPTVPVAAPTIVQPQTPAPPAGLPNVANFAPTPWPVDLKLNAIFFGKINPRVLINGNIYGNGDDIQGVLVKSIEKDKVTLEWNGHTRVLVLEGQ